LSDSYILVPKEDSDTNCGSDTERNTSLFEKSVKSQTALSTNSTNTGHQSLILKKVELCREVSINWKRKIRQCIEIRKFIDSVINFETDIDSISDINSWKSRFSIPGRIAINHFYRLFFCRKKWILVLTGGQRSGWWTFWGKGFTKK